MTLHDITCKTQVKAIVCCICLYVTLHKDKHTYIHNNNYYYNRIKDACGSKTSKDPLVAGK